MEIVCPVCMRDPQEAIEFRIAIVIAGVGVMIALLAFIFNSPLAATIALLPLTAAFIIAMWYLYCNAPKAPEPKS